MDVIDAVVITGGTVYDGSGGEGYRADLLVRGGRIEAIRPGPGTAPSHPDPNPTVAPVSPIGPRGGSVPRRAERASAAARSSTSGRTWYGDLPPEARIDATGLVVAPGFIDLHSHSDLILSLPPKRRQALQRGKLLQGITTEIAGNCGLGAAPLAPGSRDALRSALAWMTPEGTDWRWNDFAGHLARVESSPLPLNAGFLAAHGAIRCVVLGMDAARADGAAIERMQDLVREALEAGAFGLSCGLIYPPGMHADTQELVAAAVPVARAGRLFTSHIRGSSETLLPAAGELIAIGRRTSCRVHHSHIEAVGPAHWSGIPAVLDMAEAARREGCEVTSDLFPYHAAATSMAALYPPRALDGGIGALLARLRDGSERAGIRNAVESQRPAWPPWEEDGWPHNLVLACGYERIFVARTGGKTGGRYDGLSLRQLGEARGCDPFEAISDLMLEEDGAVGQWIFGISGEEADDAPLTALLRSAYCAIATDACDYGTGMPHPAAYGTFPRIFARFVRERSVLSLSEAIRRMTALPASILGLEDRGRIAEGCAADLVIFDPATIADRASFAEPRREAAGIRHVLVGGGLAVRDGAMTGADSGVLLRAR